MKGGLGWMKNIWNDPRSLFNGNHFSSYPRAQASMVIGERSEPLSRVFNDQPRGIYIYMVESVRTYVSNTHAHVRMSVCY